MNLTLTGNSTESDVSYLRQQLLEYNRSHMKQDPVIEHVRFMLRNEDQEILGGLAGIIYMDCLTIDLLWVSDELRGQGYGKKLLSEAEGIARSNQCTMILLDTFSFQAPDFYQRNGYRVHSVVKDCPVKAVDRFYMMKTL